MGANNVLLSLWDLNANQSAVSSQLDPRPAGGNVCSYLSPIKTGQDKHLSVLCFHLLSTQLKNNREGGREGGRGEGGEGGGGGGREMEGG